MSDKIAIMGVGAVGSYVGAYFVKEGEDVTFIDMWPEHVETMRSKGLRASGSQGDFTVPVNAMNLTDAQNIYDLFDIAIISVKSYDTEWATHFIKRYVKSEGFFVSIQNCWNDPLIGDIVGPGRALGCVASSIEVALWEPGHVNRGGSPGRDHGHTVFRVGEHNGIITPKSEKMAGMLDRIDAAYASDNLWGERWTKLCQNSMGNAISAMSTMGSQDLAKDPRTRMFRNSFSRKEGSGLSAHHEVTTAKHFPSKPSMACSCLWRSETYAGDTFSTMRQSGSAPLRSSLYNSSSLRRPSFAKGKTKAKTKSLSCPSRHSGEGNFKK